MKNVTKLLLHFPFREIEKLKEDLRVRRESEDQMKQVFQKQKFNLNYNVFSMRSGP